MRCGKAFPDAQDVREQAQRHPRVFRALMLEEQVQKCVAALEFQREKQIAFQGGELRVHKR
jgi:hypothetical protein